MSISEFEEYAEEFLTHVNLLGNKAEGFIPQARKELDAASPPLHCPSVESAAEHRLRGLSEGIEELMLIYDELQKSIGMAPRYQEFFRSLREVK